MNSVQNLAVLIQEYIAFAEGLPSETILQKLLQDRKESPSEHPGHMAFYDAVGKWAVEFQKEEPSQEELVQVLELLLLTAAEQKNSPSYWFLVAVQRHSLELIPMLSAENREELAPRFASCYAKSNRAPVQNEILNLLENKPKKKGFFFRK